MANQIQGTVYQIDGSPLSAPIQVAFLTSNIYIREFETDLIPQVNAAIVYYPNTNNQLQEQTFLVSESASTLITAANVNGTTQVSTTVLEINQEPQIPGGLNFSFPTQGISIWPVAVPVVGGVNSFLEFKNKKYYLLESKATLVAAANAGGGGGTAGIDTVLAQGQLLTDNRQVDCNNFELDIINAIYLVFQTLGGTSIRLDDAANSINLYTSAAGSRSIWLTGDSQFIGTGVDTGASCLYLNQDTTNGFNFIVTQNGGIENGFKLDFAVDVYKFGNFNSANFLLFDGQITQLTSDGTISIFAQGTCGLYSDLDFSLIGDVNGGKNSTKFGVNDDAQTLTATNNLIDGAGLPTNVRLKINIGGIDYKIVLETV